MKKKSKIISVSLSKGIAASSAIIKTFKPLILVIVLSGLNTLKDLKPDMEAPPPVSTLIPTSCLN